MTTTNDLEIAVAEVVVVVVVVVVHYHHLHHHLEAVECYGQTVTKV